MGPRLMGSSWAEELKVAHINDVATPSEGEQFGDRLSPMMCVCSV